MSATESDVGICGNESGQDMILIPRNISLYLKNEECSVTIPAPFDPLGTTLFGIPRIPFKTRLPGILAVRIGDATSDGFVPVRPHYQSGAVPLTGDMITSNLTYWRHAIRDRYADAAFEASLDAFIDLFRRSEPHEAGAQSCPSLFEAAFNGVDDTVFKTEVSRVQDFVVFTIESNTPVGAGRPSSRNPDAFREHMAIRLMSRLKAHPLVPVFTDINIQHPAPSDSAVDDGVSIRTKRTLVMIDMISVAQGADIEGVSFHEAAGRVLSAVRKIGQTLIDEANDQSAIVTSLVLGGLDADSHLRVSLPHGCRYSPSYLLREFVCGQDGIITKMLEHEPALCGQVIVSIFEFVCEVTIWSAINGSGRIYCSYDSAGQRSIPSDLFFDWFRNGEFRAPGNIEVLAGRLPAYQYVQNMINDYKGGWDAIQQVLGVLRQALHAASFERVPLDRDFLIKTPHSEQANRSAILLSEQDALELILDAATALWPEGVSDRHISIVNAVDRNVGNDDPYQAPYLRIDADGNEWLPRFGMLGSIFELLSNPAYRKSPDYSSPARLMDMIAGRAEDGIAFRTDADIAFRELTLGTISLMPRVEGHECADIIQKAGLPFRVVAQDADSRAAGTNWTANALAVLCHAARLVCNLVDCGALPLMPGKHTHASYLLQYVGMDEIHNLIGMATQRKLGMDHLIKTIALTDLIWAIPGDEDTTACADKDDEVICDAGRDLRKVSRNIKKERERARFETGALALTGARRTHYGYIEMQLLQPLKTMVEMGY